MSNEDIVPGFDFQKDDSLKIELRRINELPNGLVLYLTGVVDTYNSIVFQHRINKAIDKGFTKLAFICPTLNYISSSGIGAFVALDGTLKKTGGAMVFQDLHPSVHEIFEILGFLNFFNVRDSFHEAINCLKNADQQNKPKEIFPLSFACPFCKMKLTAQKAGTFRCSKCKNVISVSKSGKISFE